MMKTVNKAGGKAVANGEAMVAMGEATMRERPSENMLIVSAYDGVTDLVVNALDDITKAQSTSAKKVKEAFDPVEAAVMKNYNQIPGDQKAIVDAFAEDLSTIKREIRDSGVSDLSPREETYSLRDCAIRHLGEGSARRGTVALYNAHGIPAHDLGEVLVDGEGTVNQRAQAGFEQAFKRMEDLREVAIWVAGGDVGDLERGVTLEQGRSYSDPNAVNAAIALRNLGIGSGEAVFWKPEPGMMTADPTIFEGIKNQAVQQIKDISLAEALEIGRAGSSLLHVGALEMALKNGINARLRGIATLDNTGTSYGISTVPTTMPFKTIASHPHDVLTLDITAVSGESGITEYLGRVFGEAGISVNDIITEGNSISFTVPLPKDNVDKEYLRSKIRHLQGHFGGIEINGTRRQIKSEWSQEDMANVCVVGSELENQEGILAGLTMALAAIGINIKQVAHTDQQNRISFYVPHQDRERAVRVIHMAYFDKPEAYTELMRKTRKKAKAIFGDI